MSCSDLQTESATANCSDALNNQNWSVAISSCSGKSKGDAYMGAAGFTTINLMENSGTVTKPNYIKNASGVTLKDENPAKILKFIGIDYEKKPNESDRKTLITNAKKNFDLAMSSDAYYGALSSSDDRIKKDSALMYIYANLFALQLEQIKLYDSGAIASCTLSSNCSGGNVIKFAKESGGNKALVLYDGYIFKEDEYANQGIYGSTPSADDIETFCRKLKGTQDNKKTLNYLQNITNGFDLITLESGKDNTKFITEMQKATCTAVKVLHTSCLTDADCKAACDASDECSGTGVAF